MSDRVEGEGEGGEKGGKQVNEMSKIMKHGVTGRKSEVWQEKREQHVSNEREEIEEQVNKGGEEEKERGVSGEEEEEKQVRRDMNILWSGVMVLVTGPFFRYLSYTAAAVCLTHVCGAALFL